MSSTEVRGEERGAIKDRSASDFFTEVLIPVALRERESGREFFALRSDEAAESYKAALELVSNDSERRFLERRLKEVQSLPQ